MKKKISKTWKIQSSTLNNPVADQISHSLGISERLASIIANRGYSTVESAVSFIQKRHEVLHDPFLLNDMDKAVARIGKAIQDKEKITIFGDYDVDGVTSVSILCMYLSQKGAAVDYYIPCRMNEGYGVSTSAVKHLKEQGTGLIITVDTGITAICEVELAKEFGIDFVITDHHECADSLPNAVAVINPKRHDSTYPFSNLAGVGVAYKLLSALEQYIEGVDIIEAMRRVANDYSDLVAIGTIADVMPVIDENRILIAYGLKRAEVTDNLGLSALINYCRNGEGKTTYKSKQKKKLSSGFVGFSLAPKINAAGRIKSATIAAEMFLAKDAAQADKLSLQLCDINKERQAMENKMADEAYEYLDTYGNSSSNIIVLDNNEWHHGVVGIVSSRVTDKYGLPSILISFEGNENPDDPEAVGKGSGRSIDGMNLVNALFSCADILEKFGGHELAAGLSIKRKNLPEFKRRMEEYAKKSFDGTEPEHVLEIDCELETNEVNLDFAQELCMLEPYGVSNPTPVFAIRNAVIDEITPVGMNRHLKLTLKKDGASFVAMMFSTTLAEFPLSVGDEVDFAFNIDVNEFNGVSSVQINIKDIRPSERTFHFEKVNEEMFESIKNGDSPLDGDYIIPQRQDFARVYNQLLAAARVGKETYRVSRLLSFILKNEPNCGINYIKVKFAIKVFRELNIVNIEEIDAVTFSFSISFAKNKTSLDKSSILKKLKFTYSKK